MTHGGRRPGAGRPRGPVATRAPRATLPADVAADLARICRRLSCSPPEAIRYAIRAYAFSLPTESE